MPNRPMADRPPCPECSDQTTLARVMPGSIKGFIREFFECPKCGRLWEWEVPDPVQHATGWIAGELKPERQTLLAKIEQTRRVSVTSSDKLTTERLAKIVSDLEVELRQMD
jgi:hypothetical protein